MSSLIQIPASGLQLQVCKHILPILSSRSPTANPLSNFLLGSDLVLFMVAFSAIIWSMYLQASPQAGRFGRVGTPTQESENSKVRLIAEMMESHRSRISRRKHLPAQPTVVSASFWIRDMEERLDAVRRPSKTGFAKKSESTGHSQQSLCRVKIHNSYNIFCYLVGGTRDE
jgi:hypothetical protein